MRDIKLGVDPGHCNNIELGCLNVKFNLIILLFHTLMVYKKIEHTGALMIGMVFAIN